MADTPCACDRATATIYINPILYSRLSPFERKFWIWHEKGHILLNTEDELRADEFAFNKMAGTEWRSLKQMLEALEHLLDETNYYHQERIDHIYRLALKWDEEHPMINKSVSSNMLALGQESTKQSEIWSKTVSAMGQLIILNKTTTETATQKKDNTMTLTIVALAAMFIFMKFIEKR